MDEYTNFGDVIQMDEASYGGGIQLTYGELKALAWREAVCSRTRRKAKCGRNINQCKRCSCGHAHLMYNHVDARQRLVLDQMTDEDEGLLERSDRDFVWDVIGWIAGLGAIAAVFIPIWRWILSW